MTLSVRKRRPMGMFFDFTSQFFTEQLVRVACGLRTRIQRQQKMKKKRKEKRYRRKERTELAFTEIRAKRTREVFLYGKSGSACLLHTRKWVK